MLYIGLGMQNGPTEHHRPIYMSPVSPDGDWDEFERGAQNFKHSDERILAGKHIHMPTYIAIGLLEMAARVAYKRIDL